MENRENRKRMEKEREELKAQIMRSIDRMELERVRMLRITAKIWEKK